MHWSGVRSKALPQLSFNYFWINKSTFNKLNLNKLQAKLILGGVFVHFLDDGVLFYSLTLQYQLVSFLKNTVKFFPYWFLSFTSSLLTTIIRWSIFGVNWQDSCSRSSREALRVSLEVWWAGGLVDTSTVLALRRGGGPSSSLPSSIFTKLCLKSIIFQNDTDLSNEFHVILSLIIGMFNKRHSLFHESRDLSVQMTFTARSNQAQAWLVNYYYQ